MTRELERIDDLGTYDAIIVAFSGGKDSEACVLHLLDLGVDRSKIELWHHDVDGRMGGAETYMDWPCTSGYCRSFARDMGLKIKFQWREGGFVREMMRYRQPTAPRALRVARRHLRNRGRQR